MTASDTSWDGASSAGVTSPASAASSLKDRVSASVRAEKDVVMLAAAAGLSGAKTAGTGAAIAVVGLLITVAMLIGALLIFLSQLLSPLAAFLIVAGLGALVALVGYLRIKSGAGCISEVIQTVKR